MTNCLFCQFVEGKTKTDFVYEDKDVVAFKDIHPKAPVHILIVPKKHIDKLQDIEDNDGDLLGSMLLAAKKIAISQKIDQGYKIIINCGREGGQEIFHLHFHLLGGWGEKRLK